MITGAILYASWYLDGIYTYKKIIPSDNRLLANKVHRFSSRIDTIAQFALR